MSAFEHGYALVVGVAGYSDPALPELPLAVLNDAVDFACTLWNPEICGYRADRVRLLLDEQATEEGILQGLDWLSESCWEDKESTALIFFSGHGLSTANDSYLAAHDARVGDSNVGLIAGGELTKRLQAIRAARMAVFLDCCHSGGIAEIKGLGDGPRSRAGGLDERTYEALSTGRGRVLVASSGASEPSRVRRGERNSLFSSCLLRGLWGEAGQKGASLLGIFDLFTFVSGEVKRQSLGQQEPLFKAQVRENFPCALRPLNSSPSGAEQREPSQPEIPAKRIATHINAKYFRDINQKYGE